MILDKIENMNLYFHDMPQFEQIFNAYNEYMISPFDSGKLEIKPELLWANVATYEPKPLSQCKYEAHRLFCDVQIMIEGEEQIGWAPLSDCKITEDYKDGGDIAFLTTDAGQLLTLKKGTFMVFFPNDAHMPCIRTENADKVKKVVFKVRL